MADQAKPGGIAWTDETFNPVRGCRKLSAGCAHCYAAELSRVNPGVLGTWGANGRRVISADGWEARFDAWEKRAAKAGKPMRIFVNSMWDPGEGPDLNGKEGRDGPRPEYLSVLGKLVHVARRCPHLRLQMLTKRPWNLVAWWQSSDLGEWPANLWIGASTEDQASADERIPWLLQLPAAVRFLSVEPLLGDVGDMGAYLTPAKLGRCPCILCQATGFRNRVAGELGSGQPGDPRCPDCCDGYVGGIGWVIVGGESGRGARPMELAWVRALRDQCVAAEVPLFFKQAMEGRELVSLPALDGKVWDEFPVDAGQAGLFGAAR